MSASRARKKRIAVCVRCGCTDLRCCPEGCFWIQMNSRRTRGICSACATPQEMEAWDGQGQHRGRIS